MAYAMLCYGNLVLVSLYLYLLRIEPTTPGHANFLQAEAMSIAFCMLHLFLAKTFPAYFHPVKVP